VDATTRNSASALELPSEREIVFTRVFNAPRQVVFDAWTKPEQVRQWYGCAASTMTSCEIDLRPGGSYRFEMRLTDGTRHSLSGIYREIVPPARIVCTERIDDDPNMEALVAVTFEEHGGKTKMTTTALYLTAAARQTVLDFGVEQGASETFDRLDAYLATIVASPA
jgi:uncharacterized protein YndB with AHSA1/START domain